MHEVLIAMNVTDPAGYAAYRLAMTPILERFSGRFRYDFIVAETLRSEASHPVTRVFSIAFPARAARDAFFADPDYLAARARHFTSSTAGYTILAEVETS